MTKYTAFLLLGLPLFPLAFVACPQPPLVEAPVTIYPDYDGGLLDAEVEADALCRVMCENLARLACPESAPQGRTCTSTCTIAKNFGFDMRPICVASASTPDQARACCAPGEACTKVRCIGR